LRGNYRPFAIALHEHLHHDAVARLPRGAITVFVSRREVVAPGLASRPDGRTGALETVTDCPST